MANYGHKVFRKVNKTKEKRKRAKELKELMTELKQELMKRVGLD